MLVKVTRKHIRKGYKSAPCHCPIALAITEALGCEPGRVRVDQMDIIKWKEGGGIELEASPTTRMKEFIKRFDTYGAKSVVPTTFRINLTEVIHYNG